MQVRGWRGAFVLSLVASVGASVGAVSLPSASGAGKASKRVVAVDVAERAGIAAADTRTWSAAPVDYDGDGLEDVLIGYHPVQRLWRNQGDGTYVQVAEDAWPVGEVDRHSCAWADVDLDGRPDVYCSAGRGLRNRVKDAQQDGELWLQTNEGTFREVGTEWGVGDPCGRGRDVTFVDANGDRFPDLFVGNQSARNVADDPCDTSPELGGEGSKLFLNLAGNGFRHAPEMWDGGAGLGAGCAEVLDFNGDGRDDLLTCREGRRRPRLYAGKRGDGFRDVTSRHRLRHPVADAWVADLDRDGDPDLVTASRAAFAYHLNVAGRFRARTVVWRPRSGEGTAVAVGDADNDGDRDIYAMVGDGAEGNPSDRILLNRRLRFSPVRVPGADGAADDVVPLRRRKGRVEFLALNGYNLQGTGPVQLVRLVRGTSSRG